MIRMTPNTAPQNVHLSLTAVHTAQLVTVLSTKECCVFYVGSVTRKKNRKGTFLHTRTIYMHIPILRANAIAFLSAELQKS